MNSKPTVKVIKNGKHKDPAIQAPVESTRSTNMCSSAVRSWVVEFQERDHSEHLPSFDSLFTEAGAIGSRREIQLQLKENMKLVDTKESKVERTSPQGAAMNVYAPKSDELSSAPQVLDRKGQHLDVDGVLARSLPKTGALSSGDVRQ